MIEKMELLRLTGPKLDFDRVTEKYLRKYDIHLENVLLELEAVHELTPFTELNPYKSVLSKAQSVVSRLEEGKRESGRKMSSEQAIHIINEAFATTEEYNVKIEALREEEKRFKKLADEIEPFQKLDCDLQRLFGFRYLKFRFGKIQLQHYQKFKKDIYDDLGTIFLECGKDDDYVWGIYFVPAKSATKVDAIFSSMLYERLHIADEYDGIPKEAYQKVNTKISEINKVIQGYKDKIKDELQSVAPDLLQAYSEIQQLNQNFDIRRLAACTKERKNGHVFYILCGWMSKSDAKKFLKEIEDDELIYCIDDGDEEEDLNIDPPTKLRNPKLVKPFEMFIKMYGFPAYGEIDPTIFIAITYTLMFGIMFGDVGQGLCLVIGGFLIYKLKKVNIAAIISIAGIWSTIFGFMYGSIFGFEDKIKAVWLSPMHNIMTTLMFAVGFGVILILIAMIIHIINAIKQHDMKSLLFDQSGVPGFICYGSVVVAVLLMITGQEMPATIILVIVIGIPLLAIFLKEPLGNLIENKKEIFPEGSKAMFFIESFVEVFDVVLSYATNTISFIRVGAFALSHAGMMGVVFTLAGVESGNPNWLVIILGNLAVAGLEGLVVGIQVLRLEYYEMFSRFYKGTGKPFKSFKSSGVGQ